MGCGLSRILGFDPILMPQSGAAGINAAGQLAVRLRCQDIVQTCLSPAAAGALERIGHGTFAGGTTNVQKSKLLFFFETKQ